MYKVTQFRLMWLSFCLRTITTKYVRGINLLYAENPAGTKQYYLFNGHGDVVQLTGTDGIVTKNYDYDVFGNEKNPDASDNNVFRYCGEYFDKETGTIYLRARYYDPEIGRFISEDSYTGKDADPLSLNLYTYCHNDGVNYFDPSGHWEWNQYGDLGAGMYARLWDEGKNILQLNPVSVLMNSYNQWKALLSNEITISEIYAAGFDSIISDYKYIINSENNFISAYLPFTEGASDAQVYGAGYHVAGIIIDLATAGIAVDDIVKAVKANRAAIKAGSKSVGKAFDPKGATVQEGVNPNTLKPGKNLDTLDPKRQKDAVKYAGDKPIIVDRNGNVLDGHHRLNDAIKNGRAVDIQIGY